MKNHRLCRWVSFFFGHNFGALGLDASLHGTDAIDLPKLLEKHRMGEVYDQIAEEIVWGEVAKLAPDEALLVLRPEGEAPLVVERGPSVMVDGQALPDVSGKHLAQAGLGRHGFGVVKVMVKHGELSAAPEHLRVTREDMRRIPGILREYEPSVNERGHRTWVVPREDGRPLVIGEGGGRTDAGRLVTVYVAEEPRPLSQKKAPAESSKPGLPSQGGDTAEGAYYRDTRSPQEPTGGSSAALSRKRSIEESGGTVKERTDTTDAGLTFELQRLTDEGRITADDKAALDALTRDARRRCAVTAATRTAYAVLLYANTIRNGRNSHFAFPEYIIRRYDDTLTFFLTVSGSRIIHSAVRACGGHSLPAQARHGYYPPSSERGTGKPAFP